MAVKESNKECSTICKKYVKSKPQGLCSFLEHSRAHLQLRGVHARGGQGSRMCTAREVQASHSRPPTPALNLQPPHTSHWDPAEMETDAGGPGDTEILHSSQVPGQAGAGVRNSLRSEGLRCFPKWGAMGHYEGSSQKRPGTSSNPRAGFPVAGFIRAFTMLL